MPVRSEAPHEAGGRMDIGYGSTLHFRATSAVLGPSCPLVLACPGFTQTEAAFEGPSSSLTAALAQAGFRTAILELPRPTPGGDAPEAPLWSGLAAYTEAVAPRALSLLRRRYPGVPLVWLGHSMGGLIGAAMPPAHGAALAAMVIIGSPLTPGALPLRGSPRAVSSLGARLRHHARSRALRGETFPGAAFGHLLMRTRRLWDHGVGVGPWPWQVWAPGSLLADERRHALEGSFVDDRWGVLADLLELGLSDGERAGALPVGARVRSLTSPLLVVGGDYDGLAPLSSTRLLFERAGSARKEFLELGTATTGSPFGHIDLVLGAKAEREVWPRVVTFLHRVLRGGPAGAGSTGESGA